MSIRNLLVGSVSLLLTVSCSSKDQGKKADAPKKSSYDLILSGGWEVEEQSVYLEVSVSKNRDPQVLMLNHEVIENDKCHKSTIKIPIGSGNIESHSLKPFYRDGMPLVMVDLSNPEVSDDCSQKKNLKVISSNKIFRMSHQTDDVKGNHLSLARDFPRGTSMEDLYVAHGSYRLFVMAKLNVSIQPIINFKSKKILGIVYPERLFSTQYSGWPYKIGDLDLNQRTTSMNEFEPDLGKSDPYLILKCLMFFYEEDTNYDYPPHLDYFTQSLEAVRSKKFDQLLELERNDLCLNPITK